MANKKKKDYQYEVLPIGLQKIATIQYCVNKLRGVTKQKRDCSHKNFSTFLAKLQIVPFKVLLLLLNALLHSIQPSTEALGKLPSLLGSSAPLSLRP